MPESASSKEVTELKSQVSCLTDRLEELNHQVEYLSNAVRKLQLISPSDKEDMSDVGKKRKVQLPRAVDVPLQRMTSTDSSFMLDQYRMEQEEVPTGSDFKDFTWFQNDNIMETEDDGLLDEGLMNDLLASTPRAPSSSSTAIAAPSSSVVTTSATPASPSSDSQLPVASVAATAVSDASVGDFTSIIESLSPELKVRFLDKVAESMGAHLALNVNFGQREVLPISETTKFQAVPPTYSSTPSFLLPSGKPAPEIAFPLASAALGAFMQHSLHAMKHSNSVDIQDHAVKV